MLHICITVSNKTRNLGSVSCQAIIFRHSLECLRLPSRVGAATINPSSRENASIMTGVSPLSLSLSLSYQRTDLGPRSMLTRDVITCICHSSKNAPRSTPIRHDNRILLSPPPTTSMRNICRNFPRVLSASIFPPHPSDSRKRSFSSC